MPPAVSAFPSNRSSVVYRHVAGRGSAATLACAVGQLRRCLTHDGQPGTTRCERSPPIGVIVDRPGLDRRRRLTLGRLCQLDRRTIAAARIEQPRQKICRVECHAMYPRKRALRAPRPLKMKNAAVLPVLWGTFDWQRAPTKTTIKPVYFTLPGHKGYMGYVFWEHAPTPSVKPQIDPIVSLDCLECRNWHPAVHFVSAGFVRFDSVALQDG